MGNFAENLNLGNRFRPPCNKLYVSQAAARVCFRCAFDSGKFKLLFIYFFLLIFFSVCVWMGVWGGCVCVWGCVCVCVCVFFFFFFYELTCQNIDEKTTDTIKHFEQQTF